MYKCLHMCRPHCMCADLREADGKHREVSLESSVDGEAASCGVHGGHVLYILNLLQSLFLSVVPVGVVQMLLSHAQQKPKHTILYNLQTLQ